MHISVYIAISLDACIASEDGGLAWLDRVAAFGEDYGYDRFMQTIDTLILGRRTYDSILSFPDWPFHGKRVVVLTHRPIAPFLNVETHSGSLLALTERLSSEGVKGIYLDGGIAISLGLAEGLIDELTLSIIPVILGKGRKLFVGDLPGSSWKLIESKQFASGLVQVRYARERQE